jgi:SpoVK/Ycf46/Vps4 family AAA+-type ATPase
MKLFNRQPGPASYQPNFRIDRSGLDEVVALAVSGQKETATITSARLPAPGYKADITINPGLQFSGAFFNYPGYKLETTITGTEALQVTPQDFSGYEIHGANKDAIFHLYHPAYSRTSPISVSMFSDKQPRITQKVQYGDTLSEDEVKEAIQVYLTAVEQAVNGMYRHARVSIDETILRLQPAGSKIIKKSELQEPYAKILGKTASIDNKAENAPAPLEITAHTASFDDIGGYQTVKDELNMFLLGIKNPEMAKRHGYSPAKGILLHGPPGTGKTLFGKAIAGEAGAEFFYVDPTELLNMYVGESPKALRGVFGRAAAHAKEAKKPAIVFMDEVDTFLTTRNANNPVQSQLTNVFNQYMDGFKTGEIEGVYVVAATNRLSELDPSAVRPPRFVHVEVPLPDLEARAEILEKSVAVLERDACTQLFTAMDYHKLAEISDGYSGADLANAARTARQSAFDDAVKQQLSEPRQTTEAELMDAILARMKGSKTKPKGQLGFARGSV